MVYQNSGCSGTSQQNKNNQPKGQIMAGKARRTTHRSSTGKKLYAVRDASGKFKDIQTYERAHRADLAHKSKAEKQAAKNK
jgi:hypothetical protein